MEFNHHHHHHHHHHHDDDEETRNYPPPGLTQPPPPPGLTHPHPPPEHTHLQPPPYVTPGYIPPVASPYPPPYPPAYPPAYPPVYPPVADVTHFTPNPAYVDLVTHASVPDDLLSKPTFRIFTKAGPDYSLTISKGEIVLELTNPSDVNQHWYKDEKFSTRVKDSEGSPAFSLINKGTGEAIKHSIGSTQPVLLTPYKPSILDVDVLWSESKDQGEGFRAIRQVNDVNLNMDAFEADNGVHNGTYVVLWNWKNGDNQKWKILPF